MHREPTPNEACGMDRRRWLGQAVAAAGALLATHPLHAWSQAWPQRPVSIVVNGPPGGVIDLLARIVAERLTAALGQPVIVDNKSGGAGAIGAQEVLRAAPDGYTWLASYDGSFTESPHTTKLSLDPLKALLPVVDFASNGLMLVVGAQVPARKLSEFVAWAKEQPGGFSYGSWGVGSSAQIRALQLAKAIGVSSNHVPYRGNADAIQALLGGHLPMMFSGLVNAAPHVRTGKLRMLAFTGLERSPFFPEVPTFKELGMPDIVGQNLIGMWSRADLPAPLRERMHHEVARILTLPDVRTRIQTLNTNPGTGRTPEDLTRQLAADSAQAGALLRTQGISPE